MQMENQLHHSQWSSPSRGHNHSLWLHSTLLGLDMKMKDMIKIIGDDADCKPELVQMLEELDRSYRFLAEEHDQLRSKLSQFPPGIASSSHNFKRVRSNVKMEGFDYDPELEIPDSHPESVVEDPDSEFGSTNFDHEYLHKIADELKWSEQTGEDNPMTRTTLNSPNMIIKTCEGNAEREGTWCELKFQVTRLMEENIRQQAELVRRNAEKREAIKELRSRLQCLKAENSELQRGLICPRVDVKHKPRLRRHFSLKFLGCS